MSLQNEEKLQKLQTTEENERRSFLKKAVYATPTVVALGALMKPKQSNAASFGPPPSGPDWN